LSRLNSIILNIISKMGFEDKNKERILVSYSKEKYYYKLIFNYVLISKNMRSKI